MLNRKTTRLALLLSLVAVILTACPPKSPEEHVAKLRSLYKARLIGFIVDAVPELAEPLEEGDREESPAVAEAASEAAVEGEGMETEAPSVPMRQNVRIDILLQHDSAEKLPGITLDVEMVDAEKVRKGSWRFWVDTSELPKATGTQFTHLLEDVDYVEGDGFNVEVRSPVPVEERGDYKEFSTAGAG